MPYGVIALKELASTQIFVSARTAGTVRTRCHVSGKDQVKEQGGGLVSRSLTLPSAGAPP